MLPVFYAALLAVCALSPNAAATHPSKAITEAPIAGVALSQLMQTQQRAAFTFPFPGSQYRFSLVFCTKANPHVLVEGPENERLVLSIFDRKKFVPIGKPPVFFISIDRASANVDDAPGTSNHLFIHDSNKNFVYSIELKRFFKAAYDTGFKISHGDDHSVLYAPMVTRKKGGIVIAESVQMLRRDDRDTYWSSVFPLNRLDDHINWFKTFEGRRIGVWLDPRKNVRFWWMDSAAEQHLPPRVPPVEAVNAVFNGN